MSPAQSADSAGWDADRTAAEPAAGFDAPAGARQEPGRLVAGRRTRHTAPTSLVAAPPEAPAEEFEAPAAATATDETGTARSRRRMGRRKGDDIDRELWPAEAFGGVSDEQFWDDLAADKPLATTARTAQPEGGARRRLPEVAASASTQASADPARGDGRVPGRGRRAAGEAPGSFPPPGSGTFPPPGSGTFPPPGSRAADQTLVHPVQAATGPAAQATQPYPARSAAGATQPVHAAAPLGRAAAQLVHAAQPARAAAQPARATRHQAAADDDPLTSPAYALRRQGSVDGHSSLPTAAARLSNGRSDGYQPGGRTDPLPTDPYRTDPLWTDPLRPDGSWPGASATIPARSQPASGPGGARGSSVVRPYAAQHYAEPAQPTQPAHSGNGANAPSYGYETQPARTVSPGDDLRRPDGQRGNGRGRARPAYPPVNGYGGQYDPRGGDRRLNMR